VRVTEHQNSRIGSFCSETPKQFGQFSSYDVELCLGPVLKSEVALSAVIKGVLEDIVPTTRILCAVLKNGTKAEVVATDRDRDEPNL
jgi:hypothetical protein